MNYFNKKLNFDQKINVQNCFDQVNFPFTYLIQGPPGTGKTCTLVELVMQYLTDNKRILVASSSNAAVDNLAYRFIEKSEEYGFNHKEYNPIRLGSSFKIDKKIEPLKLKNLENSKKKAIEDSIRKLSDELNLMTVEDLKYNTIATIINDKRNQLENLVKEIVSTSKITFCTLTSSLMEDILDGLKWDVLIIDEASQSKLSECLIPIKHCNKVIFAGDEKQLSPILKTNTNFNNQLNEEFRESLFEMLIKRQADFLSFPLKIQFRMNHWIMDFPSSFFYKNSLIAHESIRYSLIKDLSHLKGSKTKHFSHPIIYFDTTNLPNFKESQREHSYSYYNEGEAKIICKLITEYTAEGVKYEDIGVISGYQSQINCLSNMIEDEMDNIKNLEINTVDSFQGREKEIIFVSLVRTSQLGFYKEIRRLNVALTRAKRQLVIVGSLSKFSELSSFYDMLLKYLKQNAVDLRKIN